MPRSPATLTSYYYCGAKGLAVASSMSACSPACQPPRRQAPIQPCWLLTLRQRWSASLAASAQGAISGSHTTPLQAHQARAASTRNRAMKGHQHKRKKPRCRLSASRGRSCGCASACWRPGRAHQAIAGRGPGGCACSTGLLASAVLGCVHLRLARGRPCIAVYTAWQPATCGGCTLSAPAGARCCCRQRPKQALKHIRGHQGHGWSVLELQLQVFRCSLEEHSGEKRCWRWPARPVAHASGCTLAGGLGGMPARCTCRCCRPAWLTAPLCAAACS